MAWLDWISDYWVQLYEKHPQHDIRPDLESLRQECGEDFAYVLEALSHADPVRLLAASCPPDEYVGETERIIARLPEVESKEELRDLMWTGIRGDV